MNMNKEKTICPKCKYWLEIQGHEWSCPEQDTNILIQNLCKKVDDIAYHLGIK